MSKREDIENTKREALPRIDLSHLSGSETEKVLSTLGTSLVAGNLKVIFEQLGTIQKMPLDEFNKIKELAVATRSHCGGFGCG